MEKYVAFLDILGFKDLVTNNTHSNLIQTFETVLKEVDSKSVAIWKKIPELNDDESKIEYQIISDSILIWTPKDDPRCFGKMIITVQSFLLASILNGIPVRGGIVIGDIDKIDIPTESGNKTSFILGKALVDAYKIESNQNWSGCIVSDDAIARFVANRKDNIDVKLEDFIAVKKLIKYKVPLKQGEIKEEYVINWPQTTDLFKITENTIRTSFALHSKNTNTWDVEQKILNTISFLNFSNNRQ